MRRPYSVPDRLCKDESSEFDRSPNADREIAHGSVRQVAVRVSAAGRVGSRHRVDPGNGDRADTVGAVLGVLGGSARGDGAGRASTEPTQAAPTEAEVPQLLAALQVSLGSRSASSIAVELRGQSGRVIRHTPAGPGWWRPRARSVHPRAGGEHAGATFTVPDRAGSSPRGRGTPGQAVHHDARRRFIPARAGNTRPRFLTGVSSPVHPRAGGEHNSRRAASARISGSSPRGRGTRLRPSARACPRRFIPARAGNTPNKGARGARPSVHPRAGGEHPRRSVKFDRVIGSSPRGRGTPLDDRRHRRRQRFIPARAGNTGEFKPF